MEEACRRFSLAGRTALVTGASRGIGATLAEALARAGAYVVLAARDAGRLDELAARLTAQGLSVAACPADVTLPADRRRAVEMACAHEGHGRLDVLVNNAGTTYRAPAETFPEEEWRHVLEVNLTAPFLLAQEAARTMIPAGRGSIINITSLMSVLGGRDIPAYAASKGGLSQLTRALAGAWARYGIRVNALGPGYVRTELNIALQTDEERNAAIVGRTPLGRWAQPADLTGALLFLASDASSFVTGQSIYVDGGYLTS